MTNTPETPTIDPECILYATVDSLRYDAVTQDNMPYVASLAQDGIWFDRMYSTAPATAASFMSLMASRYYSDVDGVGLPEKQYATLAEVLQPDFETSGYSANQFTSSYYNYDRGFDWFQSPSDGLKFLVRRFLDEEALTFQALEWAYHWWLDLTSDSQAGPRFWNDPAEVVNDWLLSKFNRSDSSQFLWAHYMDPHHPLEPPKGYLPESVPNRSVAQQITRAMPGDIPDEKAHEMERVNELYDASCRYFDDEFRGFHDTLPDDTLTIILGDHGELLGEHGRYGHPHEMWEELIRIPCVIYHPSLPSTSIEKQQTTLSILPTTLSLLNRHTPTAMRGNAINIYSPTQEKTVFGTIETLEHVGYARTSDWKFIRHKSRRSTQENQGDMLYPASTGVEHMEDGKNRRERRPGMFGTLRERYNDEVTMFKQASGRQFEDEEVKRHMADLGYLEQQ